MPVVDKHYQLIVRLVFRQLISMVDAKLEAVTTSDHQNRAARNFTLNSVIVVYPHRHQVYHSVAW